MSSDLAEDDYLSDYSHVRKDAIGVSLFRLVLATAVVGFALAAYVDRNVTATFIASTIPREERWRFSRQNFRGLPIIFLHRLLKCFLLSLFPASGSSLMKCFLLSVISDLVLSTLKVSNVHTVLNISQVPLHRRIFNQSIWFDIFPATLLYSSAWNSCFYLTVYTIRALGFVEDEFTITSRNISLYVVLFTFGILYFGAMVPAYAIFVRVAVSLNPFQDTRRQTRNLDIKSAWGSLSWSTLRMLLGPFYMVFLFEFAAASCIMLCSLMYFPEDKYHEVGRVFVKYAG